MNETVVDTAKGTTEGAVERLVPSEAPSEEWMALQLARYDYAARYVRPGRLLDIACGSGYGTDLLASRAPDVACLGVDLDPKAIQIARSAYSRANTEYRVADAMTFTSTPGFDTIVSLETIEHLPRPAEFVANLVSMLQPNGRIIASVPCTPSTDANPFHLQDFSEASFSALFAPHPLRRISRLRLVEPFASTPTFTRPDRDLRRVFGRMMRHYLRHPASLARRALATMRYGFENRYVVSVWERLP